VAEATARVRTGLERLAGSGFAELRGSSVAVLTHPAAILPDATHAVDALVAGGVDVRLLLGMEHGVRGSVQAGLSETASTDPGTGLPVVDTYGLEVRSGRSMADEVGARLAESGADTLVIDLQNCGARFYTYESSMYDMIRATASSGLRILILDRPNPIGGTVVDGPVLEPGYASFVGRERVAMRHGLTVGELARLFAARLGAPEPQVVALKGWRRDLLYTETGLPWVPPSPNLPTPVGTLCYAGTCLFEGTEISEGRGTTSPFELLGAPWMDGSWARDLRAAGSLPGVIFREAYFVPAAGPHAGSTCCGVQLHVTDPHAFDPLRTALHMLVRAQRRWPERFGFLDSFDLLVGTDRVREAVLAGRGAEDIAEEWRPEAQAFREARESVLMY
jgi:uncharacterized protein YbbC (DUF1343 family)